MAGVGRYRERSEGAVGPEQVELAEAASFARAGQDVDVFVPPATRPAPPDFGGGGAGSSGTPPGSPDPRALGAPGMFFCPISQQLLRDPVLLPTGQTYERKQISRWLKGGNLRCPSTGQQLTPPVALVPNLALRQSVEEWCERHMPELLNKNGRLKPLPDDDGSDDALDIRKIGFHTDMGDRGDSWRRSADEESGRSQTVEVHQETRYMHGTPLGRRRRGSDVEHSESASRPTPWFLYAMTLIFTSVFVAEIGVNGWVFAPLSVNPLIGPSVDTLIKMGAKVTSFIVYQNEWWRVLSSIFLSAGVVQLLANITVMWTFGRYLEREVTSITILSVFFLAAAGGVLVSANMAPDAVTVGSSGGVFGLLGATWAEQVIDWSKYKNHWLTFLTLSIITAINVFLGLLPYVDNWCNLGGFVIGLLLCCTVLLTRRHTEDHCQEFGLLSAQILCGLSVLGIFVMFILGLILNFEMGQSCSWCHYLTCIPTEWWVCDDVVTDQEACFITEFPNATVGLQCPGGQQAWVPTPAEASDENYVRLCQQQCGFVDLADTGVLE